ncbi:MAG: prolipoprotein diacylglyceryl transferase [Planctomycetota bacterium]
MHPEVIPGWPLHSYGLMLVVAFYSAYFLSRRTAKKEGVHPDRMIDILVIGALLGIIGARAFFVLQYGVSSFWQVFAIWRGGLVFYGGLVLATVGLIAYIRKKKLPLRRLADAAAPAIMLGLGFGRIGCFLNGCCWGAVAPETFPLAVRFPRFVATSTFQPDRESEGRAKGRWRVFVRTGAAEQAMSPEQARRLYRDAPDREDLSFIWIRDTRLPDGRVRQERIEGSPAFRQHLLLYPDRISPDDHWSLPVHPTQLYSSFSGFLICGLLLLWRRRRRRPGEVFALMGCLYAIARFSIEFVRNDTPPIWFGLNMGQLVGLPVFLVALAAFVYCRARPATLDKRDRPS